MAQYWYFTDAGLLEGTYSSDPSKIAVAYGTLYIEDNGTKVSLKFVRDNNGTPSVVTLCEHTI